MNCKKDIITLWREEREEIWVNSPLKVWLSECKCGGVENCVRNFEVEETIFNQNILESICEKIAECVFSEVVNTMMVDILGGSLDSDSGEKSLIS